MARRKKEDGFELAWKGLVVIPSLIGFWLVFRSTHAVAPAMLCAGAAAGLGMGIIYLFQSARREKLKRSGILAVDKMSGRDFEHFLGHLFRSQGYAVQVTRESGDYGADLVIQKDGLRIVVQAKRHKKNVGIKAVQEVQASIAHYKANAGWVITNSGFTVAAVNLAKSNGIRLTGRKDLVEMMLAMNGQGKQGDGVKSGTQSKLSETPQTKTCEKCGRPVVLRKSSTTGGMAYVCSSFPTCRTIIRMSK